MKLLYLNHNPLGLGTYFRVLFLARHLARFGHTTTLVCSSAARFDLAIRRHQPCDGVTVITLPAVVLHKFLTGRTPRALLGSLYTLVNRYDLLHAFAVSQPETALPALAARLLHRRPMLTDWDDDWGRGILADHPAPIRWPYDLLERRAVRLGDATTVVSEHLRQRAIECGVPDDRVQMIPNGANIDDIQPMDRDKCRRELAMPATAPIVVAMGHTYYIHKIYFLLDGFRKLLDRVPEAKLYLVGGLDPQKVSDYCGDLMDRITVAGERPFAEVKYYLGAANVLALPMDSSIFEISRYPIRFGDYLASGRPIVSNAVGEPKRIIEAEGCGLTSAPDDVDGFANAAAQLLADPAMADTMGQKARTAAEERYSWQAITARLHSLYVSQMARRGAGGSDAG